MTRFSLCIAVFLLLFVGTASRAWSADVVRLSEEGARVLVGSITEINATEVKILRTNSNTPISVPANTISATQFDQEPPTLTAMRTAVNGSRFPDVLETAQKLDPETIASPFARQDYEFFLAYAMGQIALTTPENKENLQKAITANADFLKNNPKSYHFYPICEQLGDLYLTADNRENAFQAFSLLAKAPWVVSQLKANYTLGSIRLDENKPDDARKFFELVLASDAPSEETLRVKTEAEIGLAKCLLRSGDWKTAIANLDALSAKTDPEDAKLQAAIYLAYGESYEAAGNPREAILAYLHIEILFPSAKAEYVSALKRLVVLWAKVNRPERAAEAEKTLKTL